MATQFPEVDQAILRLQGQNIEGIRREFAVSLTALDWEGEPIDNTVYAQIVPETVEMQHGSSWATIDVPGLSHQVHQWSHTLSTSIRFDLRWDYLVEMQTLLDQTGTKERILMMFQEEGEFLDRQKVFRLRDFLIKATRPVARGLPPTLVLFAWPNFLVFTGFIESVEFSYTRFSKAGFPVSYTARVQMKELRFRFRSAEEDAMDFADFPPEFLSEAEIRQAIEEAFRQWGEDPEAGLR